MLHHLVMLFYCSLKVVWYQTKREVNTYWSWAGISKWNWVKCVFRHHRTLSWWKHKSVFSQVLLITVSSCQRLVVSVNLHRHFGTLQHCYMKQTQLPEVDYLHSLFRPAQGNWSYFGHLENGSCFHNSRCTTYHEEEEVSSRDNTCDWERIQSKAYRLLCCRK